MEVAAGVATALPVDTADNIVGAVARIGMEVSCIMALAVGIIECGMIAAVGGAGFAPSGMGLIVSTRTPFTIHADAGSDIDRAGVASDVIFRYYLRY